MAEQTVETPKTWGRAKAKVEFEAIPRTTGPFTEVIAEYQRRIAKAVRRSRTRPNCLKAVSPAYSGAIAILESMNAIEDF